MILHFDGGIRRGRLTDGCTHDASGHWEKPEEAHGDKRNPEDLERWRGLAKIGTQMEKHILPEQATLNKIYGKLCCFSIETGHLS